jgi:hypothetical protein
MVKLTVRLTETEHEALTAAAYLSRRSLQREILFRLFDGDRPPAEVPGQLTLEKSGGVEDTLPSQAGSHGRPARCTAYAPRGTKCKVCGETHR